MTTLQILYHGHCFDGAVSAALFTRFYRRQVDPTATIAYRPMAHGQGDPYGPDHDRTFSADENAVVDFRYSPSSRLTWFCDHHESAFLSPADREAYLAAPSPRKCFDPTAPSCAGLLARFLAERHGFDARAVADHVRWADLIDAARFESPAQAVELAEPALQLMALLESGPSDALVNALIEGLAEGSIAEVHRRREVQEALLPVLLAQRETLDLVRARLELDGGVAYFDLSEDGVTGFNKFIPYYLHPETRYTVGLTAGARRAKVSVGSNPWKRPEPLTNLAELCGRYGGGGHPVVAGISFAPEERARARQAALEIAATLRETRR